MRIDTIIVREFRNSLPEKEIEGLEELLTLGRLREILQWWENFKENCWVWQLEVKSTAKGEKEK